MRVSFPIPGLSVLTNERNLPPRVRCRGRSVELSWEEIRHAMLQKGFLLVKEEWRRCNYTRNVRSMMHTEYDCVFFTAIKPPASF